MANYILSKTGVACPQDLGLENKYYKSKEDCECRMFYGDCFHCWENALYLYTNKIRQEAIKENENKK